MRKRVELEQVDMGWSDGTLAKLREEREWREWRGVELRMRGRPRVGRDRVSRLEGSAATVRLEREVKTAIGRGRGRRDAETRNRWMDRVLMFRAVCSPILII